MTVTHTYTDNVSLAPRGATLSDSVTQLIPGIAVATSGPRLRFNARYAPEFLYYQKLDPQETVFHRGHATGTLELAQDLFFVEAGAQVDQYEISLRGPIYGGSNINVAGNRATTRTSYLNPYLVHEFGSGARAEARLRLSTMRADDPAIADNDAGRVNLRLESGPAPTRLLWDLAYESETIDYEAGQESRSQGFTAGGRLRIIPTVGLLARAGEERYESAIAGSEVKGSLWSVGFEWTPTSRTRLAATAGKRFDDDAYTLEFRHRTRLTAWNVAYSEDVTSARSELFLPGTGDTAGALDALFSNRYPDPVERQKAVQEFIARTGLPASLAAPVNFFSQQLFLQKRWIALAGIQGVRNTLAASAFSETRQILFSSLGIPASGDFAFSETIRLSGGGVSWGWRITPRLAWNLSLSYTRNEFLDTGQTDDYYTTRAGITRHFRPHLSGSLSYRRQKRAAAEELNSYVENAYIAALQMNF